MSLLHPHRPAGAPFDEPPPSTDREAELATERRKLRVRVADLRRENDQLRADLDRAHRELAQAHRDLARRWWQR